MPPHRSASGSCISSDSGIPFCIVSSLNEPVTAPSTLAPLSPQIQMITALSSSPCPSISVRTRPPAVAGIPPGPDDDGVVQLAELVDRVDDAADVVVGIL